MTLWRADKVLPRSSNCPQKHFWSEQLSCLKENSKDAFDLWNNVGRPNSGPVYEQKKAAHYCYKAAIRKNRKVIDQQKCDSLHHHLLSKDPIQFWKSWSDIHGSKNDCTTRINGIVDDKCIADEFANSFKTIYNSNDKGASSNLRSKFDVLFSNYHSMYQDECQGCRFFVAE